MIYTPKKVGKKRNSTGSADSSAARYKLHTPAQRPQRKSAGSMYDYPSKVPIPSAPISDAGSNYDSPIFARKTVEDYYYDWDEFGDPSGVWMGPPDKREPREPFGSAAASPEVVPKRNSSVISLSRDEDRSLSHQPSDSVKRSSSASDKMFGLPIAVLGTPKMAAKRERSVQRSIFPDEPRGSDSKWTKVKRALLPSAATTFLGQTSGDEDKNDFISLPSSPLKSSNFSFVEEKLYLPEDEEESKESRSSPSSGDWQAEIQKNYEKLQRSLSQEFHKYKFKINKNATVKTV